MTSSLNIQLGGYSSAGIKPANQDAFAAHTPHEKQLLQFKGAAAAIADGVSSCEDSHIASQTAVTSFIEDYYSTPENWSVKNSVSRVLTGLNNWLYQQNNLRSHNEENMLTTFSSLVIKSTTAHYFHLGDSRIYHCRNGDLEQLTEDHTRKQQGQQFLARALGADRRLKVDYGCCPLQQGDLLLLTTDGIHEYLSQQLIAETISDTQELEAAAKKLCDMAAAAGSPDNLTALILAIHQLPPPSLPENQQAISHLPIPPVMQPGNRIDHFEVLDVIFSGTRSHMYRVRDNNDGQTYVLKAPSLNYRDDQLYLDSFAREEWVGQCLNHPVVMKTYPSPEKNFLYYIGEHVEGMNLREWMNDNPNPPLDSVRKIISQLVQGLRAFQRADMVHQDLKPENIMINRDGQIKILDFGTVQIAGVTETTSPLDKSVPQGSVNYTAPEYLLGEAGTFRSDLFSLAVICYEMLTGKLPYPEQSPHQIDVSGYRDFRYTPAISHRRELPIWMEGCLNKALQANPRYRYQALSEFEQDLQIPNRSLESRVHHQPLLDKNPILVWQLVALVLLVLNLFQLMK